MKKSSRIVRYTLGGLFIIISLLYLIGKFEWAWLPWCILLVGISLYNLIWNRPSKEE